MVGGVAPAPSQLGMLSLIRRRFLTESK